MCPDNNKFRGTEPRTSRLKVKRHTHWYTIALYKVTISTCITRKNYKFILGDCKTRYVFKKVFSWLKILNFLNFNVSINVAQHTNSKNEFFLSNNVCCLCRGNISDRVCASKAVSYTHLDVYKRQYTHARARFCNFF